MAIRRFHHFLCCLPLRLGVLVLSFLGFWGALASCAIEWLKFAYIQRHNGDGRFSNGDRTFTIVLGIVYGILAFITLFGFIGAITSLKSENHFDRLKPSVQVPIFRRQLQPPEYLETLL
ncbi:hypothetical protein CYLTODRAFT_494907 [Cylindrobasidium torrendii FP15055 ss-10]|uniref:Uncharacterized protein n=1 Tax=Cylindrobasidium torrendii FP15055 ss-10 TaxID=1314674 RepID=A0A0D7AV00_9AGAR|nr:hypothetical protein CYLTODRAFT_494907 [Cylindrobasidium torrendii FP15055 ss-10]